MVATARNFVRGFLGESADTLGSIITIDAKGGPDALFNSLGPSDQCPSYRDLNGGSYGKFPLSKAALQTLKQQSSY